MTLAITKLTDDQRAARDAAVLAANKGKASGSTDAMGQINKDFNFFLKMLTTQLQNQDPTEPMDTTAMTQQIATYSGVEQQVKTNAQLEALLGANKQSQLSTAVSYIGREVETDGNIGTLQYAADGTKTGMAEYSYDLPEDIATATVTIKDKDGNVVYTGAGPVSKGENIVRWNGINSTTKKAMDAGEYTMEVLAKNGKGEVVNVDVEGDNKLAYSDTQYGQAVFSYMLPKGAQSAQITILNSAGQAVFTGQGTLKEGRNVVVWDGVNSFNQNQMAAGKYTIQVKAKSAQGADITVETRAVGIVDTVETDASGGIILNVGDAQVKYEDILAVREATPFYVPSQPDESEADES